MDPHPSRAHICRGHAVERHATSFDNPAGDHGGNGEVLSACSLEAGMVPQALPRRGGAYLHGSVFRRELASQHHHRVQHDRQRQGASKLVDRGLGYPDSRAAGARCRGGRGGGQQAPEQDRVSCRRRRVGPRRSLCGGSSGAYSCSIASAPSPQAGIRA